MRFSNSHAHRVTKIVNGYFSCYFYFIFLLRTAYISYGRVWMVYLIVFVWFYTRRGKMWNGCGHCGDGGGGSGYKSYFWIIHPRPPTPVWVGARCVWVRMHIYVHSVRPWQLVTAPLTKGYWFISLSSKQRFIILYIIRIYTFVDGLVEKIIW